MVTFLCARRLDRFAILCFLIIICALKPLAAQGGFTNTFYEVTGDDSCFIGELANFNKTTEYQISKKFNLTIKILCVPSNLFAASAKEQTNFLVPLIETGIEQLDNQKFEREMRTRLMAARILPEYCNENPQICYSSQRAFERTGLAFRDSHSLPLLKNGKSSFSDVVNDIRANDQADLIRLVQYNLKFQNFPLVADGAFGTRTRSALEQVFKKALKESKTSNSDMELWKFQISEIIFPNFFKTKQRSVEDNGSDVKASQDYDLQIDQNTPNSKALMTANAIIRTQNAEIANLQTQISSLKATNAVLVQTIESLSALDQPNNTEEFHRLEQEVAAIREQYKRAQEIIMALQGENQRLTAKVERANSLSKDLTKRLETVKTELTELFRLSSSIETDAASKVSSKIVGNNTRSENLPEFITSISTDYLSGFEEGDAVSCYIAVRIIGSKRLDEQTSSIEQKITLYMENYGGKARLTDAGTLPQRTFTWKDAMLQFLHTEPRGQKNSCKVTLNRIPIVKNDYNQRSERELLNKPIAIISEDGSIKIMNAPVTNGSKINPLKFP